MSNIQQISSGAYLFACRNRDPRRNIIPKANSLLNYQICDQRCFLWSWQANSPLTFRLHGSLRDEITCYHEHFYSIGCILQLTTYKTKGPHVCDIGSPGKFIEHNRLVD